MKHPLIDTVKALAAQFKECCPAPANADYHLAGWHLPEEGLTLKDPNEVSPDEYKTKQ